MLLLCSKFRLTCVGTAAAGMPGVGEAAWAEDWVLTGVGCGGTWPAAWGSSAWPAAFGWSWLLKGSGVWKTYGRISSYLTHTFVSLCKLHKWLDSPKGNLLMEWNGILLWVQILEWLKELWDSPLNSVIPPSLLVTVKIRSEKITLRGISLWCF